MAKIRKQKSRRTPLEVQREIQRLAVWEGMTPSQIYRHLEKDERLCKELPTLRTVQSLVKQTALPDPSGPWGLADAEDGDDARMVLETLAELLEHSEGRIPSVSRELANWILRVRRAAPDVDLEQAYFIARLYLQQVTAGESTLATDQFLACRGWTDSPRAIRYREWVERGLLQCPPPVLSPYVIGMPDLPDSPDSDGPDPARGWD